MKIEKNKDTKRERERNFKMLNIQRRKKKCNQKEGK